MVEMFIEEELCAFCEWACTLKNTENDMICEDKWQYWGFSSSPSLFYAQDEKPILYVEIQKIQNMVYLFSLCEIYFSVMWKVRW